MRKIIALSLAFLVIASCKKREENQGPEQFIIGYWAMTDLELNGNINFMGTPIPITGEGENYQGGFDIKTGNTTDYNVTCDVIVNIPGVGQQNFPFERIGSGTWSLTNNNSELRVEESNGTVTIFPIKVLTENLMIVEQDSAFNFMGTNGNFEYEVTLEK